MQCNPIRMKSFLNTRQYDILTALLKDDCPKTIGELSNALDMQPRVIQYNLNAIDSWLEGNHARIIRRSGVGLQIDLPKQQRTELIRQLSGLDNIELVLSTRQRRRCMLLKMLSTEAPVSSGKLATEFSISRTTAINDLIEVQTGLKRYHLGLAKKAQEGFFVDGRRSLKRFAMCALYGEEHFESKIPPGDIQRLIPSKPPFDYLMSEWFDASDVEFAGKLVHKAEQVLNVHYSQISRLFLQYHVMLLLADMRKGKQINEKALEHRSRLREWAAIPNMKGAIEHQANAAANEQELQLLALHLHCQNAFRRGEPDAEAESTDVPAGDVEQSDLSGALVREISLFLNPYLQVDRVFQAEVAGFLDRCLAYRHAGFSIPNPFHEKTRAAFPDTYEVIDRICARQAQFLDDPLAETDISALCMVTTNALGRIPQITQRNVRVALVSDADEALTDYTRERILSKFPWFRIVGTFRECDMHRLRVQSVDLILSTAEAEDGTREATIQIDAFVTDRDVEHIKSWIDQNVIQKGSRPRSNGTPGLREILLNRNVILRRSVQSWEEAVYVVGEPLVRSGDLSRSYLDAIIRVKKSYGPYSVVAPHTALLHAKPTDGVRNLCVGLMVLKEGVEFGMPKYDPVNLVFILGIPDSHSHLHALYELANIIRARAVREGLRECASVEAVMEMIAGSSGEG